MGTRWADPVGHWADPQNQLLLSPPDLLPCCYLGPSRSCAAAARCGGNASSSISLVLHRSILAPPLSVSLAFLHAPAALAYSCRSAPPTCCLGRPSPCRRLAMPRLVAVATFQSHHLISPFPCASWSSSSWRTKSICCSASFRYFFVFHSFARYCLIVSQPFLPSCYCIRAQKHNGSITKIAIVHGIYK
jgi:hypothetical protein